MEVLRAEKRPNMRTFDVVVAATEDWGIGKDGSIPWNIPGDMRWFRELTSRTAYVGNRNAVIMGRKTWESIPRRFRPLPGRLNVIISTTLCRVEGAVVSRSLDDALEFLADDVLANDVESVFVIGGGQLYAEALKSRHIRDVYLTKIRSKSLECDAFFPVLEDPPFRFVSSSPMHEENGFTFTFERYVALK